MTIEENHMKKTAELLGATGIAVALGLSVALTITSLASADDKKSESRGGTHQHHQMLKMKQIKTQAEGGQPGGPQQA